MGTEYRRLHDKDRHYAIENFNVQYTVINWYGPLKLCEFKFCFFFQLPQLTCQSMTGTAANKPKTPSHMKTACDTSSGMNLLWCNTRRPTKDPRRERTG